MPEARQRELGRARTPTDGVLSLEDEHTDAGLREHNRRSKPVRPGADDDRIGRHVRTLAVPWLADERRVARDADDALAAALQ